ncbi:hypothetical protein ACOMHN_008465 [Nucella lapillus]
MASEKKQMPDFMNPNLSLTEKWRLHVEHKRRTGVATKGQYLHVLGPLFYAYTIGVGSSWLFLDILPTLYVDEWEGWLLPARLFLILLTVEVAGNWCGIRFVGSEYRPALHGTKPPDFPSDYFTDHQSGENATSTGQNMTEDRLENVPENGRRFESDNQDSNCGQRTYAKCEDWGAESTGERRPQSQAVDLNYAPPGGSKAYDGHSYRMLVATSLPTADGEIERKPFPYWSWVPCLMCQRLRPPRCHHCTLCKQCVLKRDHHCYFTGRCVGVNNTRFFLTFLLWAFLLTSFATYHFVYFVGEHLMPRYNLQVYDLIFPVPAIRGVLGYISLVVTPLVVAMWCVLGCNVISFTMMLGSLYLLVKGKTSFERDNSIKVTDTRSLGGKLSSVFGNHWWVNMLVPTYPWFKPVEDAVLWPHIKPW